MNDLTSLKSERGFDTIVDMAAAFRKRVPGFPVRAAETLVGVHVTELDAQTRAVLQEDLLRLWELGRKTIVFVTHDIAEAIALGDRTLVLSRAPAKVAGEHIISIPRPRDIRGIMSHPEFAKLYQSIREQVQ